MIMAPSYGNAERINGIVYVNAQHIVSTQYILTMIINFCASYIISVILSSLGKYPLSFKPLSLL